MNTHIQQLVSILKYVAHTYPALMELLESTLTCSERLDHHPEGNTFDHIMIVLGRALYINDRELAAAALFHDLGKAYTYKYRGEVDGVHIHSYPSHEFVSLGIARAFSHAMEDIFEVNADRVCEIIANHMRIKLYLKGKMTSPKKKAEMEQLATFYKLIQFAVLDTMTKPVNAFEEQREFAVWSQMYAQAGRTYNC